MSLEGIEPDVIQNPQLRKLRSFVDVDKVYKKTKFIKISSDMLQVEIYYALD